MSVNQLGAFHTLLIVHKSIFEKKPKYISDKMLAKVQIENGRLPLRQNDKITIPNYNLTVSRGSFCYRGAKLWNEMPSHLREITSYKVFKKNLKKWIISNIPIRPS